MKKTINSFEYFYMFYEYLDYDKIIKNRSKFKIQMKGAIVTNFLYTSLRFDFDPKHIAKTLIYAIGRILKEKNFKMEEAIAITSDLTNFIGELAELGLDKKEESTLINFNIFEKYLIKKFKEEKQNIDNIEERIHYTIYESIDYLDKFFETYDIIP